MTERDAKQERILSLAAQYIPGNWVYKIHDNDRRWNGHTLINQDNLRSCISVSQPFEMRQSGRWRFCLYQSSLLGPGRTSFAGSINISLDRSPKVIGSDIGRRLLPLGIERFAKADKEAENRAEETKRRQQKIRLIEMAFGEKARLADGHRHDIYLDNAAIQIEDYKGRVRSELNMDFETFIKFGFWLKEQKQAPE